MTRLVPTIAALVLAACGSPGSNLRVDLPPARAHLPATELALDVGRLLSTDEQVSAQAERRLLALSDAGRAHLAAHAATIPGETDPRWLNVLFEHHMLPALAPQDELAFLLWKSARAGTASSMAAQSGLTALAERSPQVLSAFVERGDAGWERVALALAHAGRTESVPALLVRYRRSRTVGERQVLAQALARLLGQEHKPLTAGTEEELRSEAERLDAWYREHLQEANDERS